VVWGAGVKTSRLPDSGSSSFSSREEAIEYYKNYDWINGDLLEGTYLNCVDMGFTEEEREKVIKALQSQPNWNPSSQIILDERDIPDDLQGRVVFRKA